MVAVAKSKINGDGRRSSVAEKSQSAYKAGCTRDKRHIFRNLEIGVGEPCFCMAS
jgi:hypothetical protein